MWRHRKHLTGSERHCCLLYSKWQGKQDSNMSFKFGYKSFSGASYLSTGKLFSWNRSYDHLLLFTSGEALHSESIMGHGLCQPPDLCNDKLSGK